MLNLFRLFLGRFHCIYHNAYTYTHALTKIAWKLAGDKSWRNAFDQDMTGRVGITVQKLTVKPAHACCCVACAYSRVPPDENSVKLTINHRARERSAPTIIYSLRGHANGFSAITPGRIGNTDRRNHKRINGSSGSLFFSLLPPSIPEYIWTQKLDRALIGSM